MKLLHSDELPAAPIGDRILVRPAPPDEESQLIIKPDDQKYRPNKGEIVAAGLSARDKLHDQGGEIGDTIWHGKFAGVMEEWDHYEHMGKGADKCQHVWTRSPAERPRDKKWSCDACSSTRIAEHILVMNVDDILGNVTLQRRIDSGVISVKRGQTTGGRTQFYVNRNEKE